MQPIGMYLNTGHTEVNLIVIDQDVDANMDDTREIKIKIEEKKVAFISDATSIHIEYHKTGGLSSKEGCILSQRSDEHRTAFHISS